MNRVAFSIGKLDIYWYGLIICLAIIVAIAVACYYCKKRNYAIDLPINIALVILPTGILAGRLFAVLFDNSLVIQDYFDFRSGGMSIIGAIIGGGLALTIYCLIKKEKNPLLLFDTLCVVLILAQAIGRWGNFVNEEVYGGLITNESLQFFPIAVKIGGQYYEALFFYESMLNLIGFTGLSIVYLKEKKCGYCTALYLIYYGIVRTMLEPRRNASYILHASSLMISKVCSILMIVVGAILFIVLIAKKDKKKEVKDGQKN